MLYLMSDILVAGGGVAEWETGGCYIAKGIRGSVDLDIAFDIND